MKIINNNGYNKSFDNRKNSNLDTTISDLDTTISDLDTTTINSTQVTNHISIINNFNPDTINFGIETILDEKGNEDSNKLVDAALRKAVELFSVFFQNDAKIELKPIDYNKIIENVSSHINNMLSVNQNNIQELKNTPYTSLKILTFFIAQSIAWAYHKDGDINSFKNYLNTMLNIGPFCVDFFSKKTSLYTQIHGFNNNFISNMFTSRDHNEDIAKTIMEIIAHINLFIKNSAMNVQASLNLYPDKSASQIMAHPDLYDCKYKTENNQKVFYINNNTANTKLGSELNRYVTDTLLKMIETKNKQFKEDLEQNNRNPNTPSKYLINGDLYKILKEIVSYNTSNKQVDSKKKNIVNLSAELITYGLTVDIVSNNIDLKIAEIFNNIKSNYDSLSKEEIDQNKYSELTKLKDAIELAIKQYSSVINMQSDEYKNIITIKNSIETIINNYKDYRKRAILEYLDSNKFSVYSTKDFNTLQSTEMDNIKYIYNLNEHEIRECYDNFNIEIESIITNNCIPFLQSLEYNQWESNLEDFINRPVDPIINKLLTGMEEVNIMMLDTLETELVKNFIRNNKQVNAIIEEIKDVATNAAALLGVQNDLPVININYNLNSIHESIKTFSTRITELNTFDSLLINNNNNLNITKNIHNMIASKKAAYSKNINDHLSKYIESINIQDASVYTLKSTISDIQRLLDDTELSIEDNSKQHLKSLLESLLSTCVSKTINFYTSFTTTTDENINSLNEFIKYYADNKYNISEKELEIIKALISTYEQISTLKKSQDPSKIKEVLEKQPYSLDRIRDIYKNMQTIFKYASNNKNINPLFFDTIFASIFNLISTPKYQAEFIKINKFTTDNEKFNILKLNDYSNLNGKLTPCEFNNTNCDSYNKVHNLLLQYFLQSVAKQLTDDRDFNNNIGHLLSSKNNKFQYILLKKLYEDNTDFKNKINNAIKTILENFIDDNTKEDYMTQLKNIKELFPSFDVDENFLKTLNSTAISYDKFTQLINIFETQLSSAKKNFEDKINTNKIKYLESALQSSMGNLIIHISDNMYVSLPISSIKFTKFELCEVLPNSGITLQKIAENNENKNLKYANNNDIKHQIKAMIFKSVNGTEQDTTVVDKCHAYITSQLNKLDLYNIDEIDKNSNLLKYLKAITSTDSELYKFIVKLENTLNTVIQNLNIMISDIYTQVQDELNKMEFTQIQDVNSSSLSDTVKCLNWLNQYIPKEDLRSIIQSNTIDTTTLIANKIVATVLLRNKKLNYIDLVPNTITNMLSKATEVPKQETNDNDITTVTKKLQMQTNNIKDVNKTLDNYNTFAENINNISFDETIKPDLRQTLRDGLLSFFQKLSKLFLTCLTKTNLHIPATNIIITWKNKITDPRNKFSTKDRELMIKELFDIEDEAIIKYLEIELGDDIVNIIKNIPANINNKDSWKEFYTQIEKLFSNERSGIRGIWNSFIKFFLHLIK